MDRRLESSGRALRRVAVLCVALALAACGKGIESTAHAGAPARPKVTVARPVLSSLTEFSEHTGRAEAPESVEIRARASGHLMKVAFREGELVKKGDLLFVIDPRPYRAALEHARAELASIRVDHELAQKNLQRAEQLHASSTISERDWDTQSTAVRQLEARAQVASAAIASAELDLEYAHVRSPIDGRIGRTFVTAGNLVGPSMPSPLTTIVSVDPLYVYIDVDETRGLRLARQSGARAKVGFPGEDGYPHDATIDFVDNRVDPATGTLKVRAVVRNPDGKLADGLFARVRLPEGGAHEALLIADRAVATDQDRRYVWVLGEGDKAQYRALKLGPLERGLRVVREGLSADDRVVVRGLQRVRAGVEVAPELVAMNAFEAGEPQGEAR